MPGPAITRRDVCASVSDSDGGDQIREKGMSVITGLWEYLAMFGVMSFVQVEGNGRGEQFEGVRGHRCVPYPGGGRRDWLEAMHKLYPFRHASLPLRPASNVRKYASTFQSSKLARRLGEILCSSCVLWRCISECYCGISVRVDPALQTRGLAHTTRLSRPDWMHDPAACERTATTIRVFAWDRGAGAIAGLAVAMM